MNAEILETARFIVEVTAYYALLSLSLIVPLLVAVAFFTLAERKIMASIQRRRGPNVVGFAGLGQPFADGLKALVKEALAPYQANRVIFIMAPGISFVLSLVNWALIPFTYEEVLADVNYGLLYIYAISSLSVYGIILAGWVSNSKYPFLGSLRSAAQMVSYEVSIGLVFCIIALCAHSLNLTDVVFAQEVSGWYGVLMWPIAAVFFVTIIAETNRAPFDLPEAEAEIVAGYNLEYSSIIFAMFFLGEYSNIFLMSTLFVVLFMGGWLPVFGLTFIPAALWLQLKAVFMCFMFVLVRATFPRYRYDQLMSLCWQVFLPFNFIYLLIIALIFALA